MPDTAPADLFDRRRRRARLLRKPRDDTRGFLAGMIVERVRERLDDVGRPLPRVLAIGSHAARLAQNEPRVTQACDADEDRLLPAGIPEGAWDAVLWAGGIEAVNDVPGALVQCRRLLVPGGVLIGCGFGAGTLATLKAALLEAEGDRPAARFHPAIDVRAMGDLLFRCGFTMPMADAETVSARYRALDALIADMRADGIGNALNGAVPPLQRATRRRLDAILADAADMDGRFAERFVLLGFTGWAPEAQGL